MLSSLALTIFFLGYVTSTSNLTFGNFTVNMVGKSGQFDLVNGVNGESLRFKFNDLTEMDSNNTAVNAPDHKVTSFANSASFSDKDTHKFPNTTVEAEYFNFKYELKNGANFTGTMYLMTTNGTLMMGNQKHDVLPGDLKFNFGVSGWTFCVNGTDQCKVNGTSLDLSYTVQHMGGNHNHTNNTIKFLSDAEASLEMNATPAFTEGNSAVFMNGDYMLDGKSATMPDGYPKTEVNGNSATFTYRFAKFSNSVVYDPVATTQLSSEDNSSGFLKAGYFFALIALFFALF